MKAAILHDERTVFVSTNRLRHGWDYQKLANQLRDSAIQQPTYVSLQPIDLLSHIAYLAVNLFPLIFKRKRLQPFAVHNRPNSRFQTGCKRFLGSKAVRWEFL